VLLLIMNFSTRLMWVVNIIPWLLEVTILESVCICEDHRNCEFGVTVDYSVFLR